MQVVKCFLLGSAAGLVCVAGAQAADLPAKAKPVEYVKICSLYGAGFWYVPGTDTCLKVGSYVRAQTQWNAGNGGRTTGAGNTVSGGHFDRSDTSQLSFRSRASISVDLRTQTEYGTLRSYLQMGQELETAANAGAGSNAATADAVFINRGFIQFAGFTVGRVRSFFDINSFNPYSYATSLISGDTGSRGLYALAYTAQFGNGVSAILSLEDGGASNRGRGKLISDVNLTPWTIGGGSGVQATTFDNRGNTFFDVVGALRVDQTWGYAQIAAALHDASGGYYATGPGGCGAAPVDCVTNGHPADKLGFAVTGGFTLTNVLGNKGDVFGMQAAFTEGAAGYATRATNPWEIYSSSSNVGFGFLSEGLFITGSPVELTTVWSINGFFQHFWNPKWRTSLWGGYVEVDYNNAEKLMICPLGVGVAQNPVGLNRVTATSNCNPDYSWEVVGTRTQWNPHPDLDIGVDLIWTHLNTAFKGTANLLSSGAQPAINGARIDDQDVFSVLFRVQRNFLP